MEPLKHGLQPWAGPSAQPPAPGSVQVFDEVRAEEKLIEEDDEPRGAA